MSIEYDHFKGDAEGEAKAAFLRATTGPKADRLAEIRDPSKAEELAAYEAELLRARNAAVGRQLQAPEASE